MCDKRNKSRTHFLYSKIHSGFKRIRCLRLVFVFSGAYPNDFFELTDKMIRAVETDKFTSFAMLVKDVKYPLSFLSDNHEQMLFDENNKDKYAVLRAIWYILMFSIRIFNFYHPNY